MEMQEIPLRAPSRQDTLESQSQRPPLRSTLKWLKGKYGANSRLSGPVDNAMEAGARRYSRDPQRFLNDFGHMSRRPEARLHEIFDIFIRLPHTALGANEGIGANSLSSSWRLNLVEAEGVEFQPAKHPSMYDWLDSLRLRLDGVDEDSFVLWRVKVVADGGWSELTHYSCFTAENPELNVAIMYNVLKPLPSQIRDRLEVPRRALIYLLAHTQGVYMVEPFHHD